MKGLSKYLPTSVLLGVAGLVLLLLAACPGQPKYVTFPESTVDTLRMYLAAPATLKVYDSAGTKWLLVQPSTTDGRALLPFMIKPLNHANECPPWC